MDSSQDSDLASTSQHVEKTNELQVTQTNSTVPTEVHVHGKTIIALFAICLIQFGQLMIVIGSGFLSQQMTGLFGDTTKAVWISSALTIFTAALNPPLSQAADFWGRKNLLVITSIGGFIGPIIVSRAQSNTTLIAGFCVTAISFGSQSAAYAVPSEIIPRQYRAWAQALVNLANTCGGVLGLLLGGSLLRHNHLENYRIYWYVVAVVYFLAFVAISMGYNPPPRDLQVSLTAREKLRKVDWIGALLITSGVTLFCIALSWSGSSYSWKDAHILATFLICIFLLMGFGLYEFLAKSDGICHHSLFRDRDFVISLVLISCEGLSFFTTNSYLVLEVVTLYHVDLFAGALRFIILFSAALVGFAISGYWITKTKMVRETMALGFLCLTIFNALMAGVKSSTTLATLWGYPVFAGLGLGFVLIPLTVSVQMSTPQGLISLATGLSITARSLGGAVGLAINNAIYQHGLKNLPSKVADAVLPLGFPSQELGTLITALSTGNVAALAQIPDITPQIIAAASSGYTEGQVLAFRYVWVAACCFGAVGFMLSFVLRNHREQFTAHIDAPAEADLVDLQRKIEARQSTGAHVQVQQDVHQTV